MGPNELPIIMLNPHCHLCSQGITNPSSQHRPRKRTGLPIRYSVIQDRFELPATPETCWAKKENNTTQKVLVSCCSDLSCPLKSATAHGVT